jgi:hypothetical protein
MTPATAIAEEQGIFPGAFKKRMDHH